MPKHTSSKKMKHLNAGKVHQWAGRTFEMDDS